MQSLLGSSFRVPLQEGSEAPSPHSNSRPGGLAVSSSSKEKQQDADPQPEAPHVPPSIVICSTENRAVATACFRCVFVCSYPACRGPCHVLSYYPSAPTDKSYTSPHLPPWVAPLSRSAGAIDVLPEPLRASVLLSRVRVALLRSAMSDTEEQGSCSGWALGNHSNGYTPKAFGSLRTITPGHLTKSAEGGGSGNRGRPRPQSSLPHTRWSKQSKTTGVIRIRGLDGGGADGNIARDGREGGNGLLRSVSAHPMRRAPPPVDAATIDHPKEYSRSSFEGEKQAAVDDGWVAQQRPASGAFALLLVVGRCLLCLSAVNSLVRYYFACVFFCLPFDWSFGWLSRRSAPPAPRSEACQRGTG